MNRRPPDAARNIAGTRCSKRSYRSERGAKAAHRTASFRIRVYKCPNCGLFHVTNHEKGN